MIKEPLPDWTLGAILLQTGAFPSRTAMLKAVKQGQVNYGPYRQRVKCDEQTLNTEICDLTDHMLNLLVIRTGRGTGLVIRAAMNDTIWYEKGW